MSGIRCVRLWRPDEDASVLPAAEDAFVEEVAEPELHVFPAVEKRNTGIGAIICPGGGYAGLSMGPEGHACAQWLSTIGVTGMVLQYRLPYGNKTIPLDDMHLAMRYAREHAADLGFSPESLGVVGFSAGGHLAATASTRFSGLPVSTRPDFAVLFYPVISMEKRKRGVTRICLLGRRPSEQDVAEYSCHLHVTPQTPPTLLFLCDDDPVVPPTQSTLYYDALKKHNVAASMHVFPKGGHGWGFRGVNMDGGEFPQGDAMRGLLADWLVARGV